MCFLNILICVFFTVFFLESRTLYHNVFIIRTADNNAVFLASSVVFFLQYGLFSRAKSGYFARKCRETDETSFSAKS